MKYLGIDFGKKKIGLATGSSETKIASPFLILENKKGWFGLLKDIINEEDIDEIVIGKALSLDGRENDSEEYVKFTKQIEKFDLPIQVEDERMSTKLANVLERDFGKTKKDHDDDIAAAAILQTYLDKLP